MAIGINSDGLVGFYTTSGTPPIGALRLNGFGLSGSYISVYSVNSPFLEHRVDVGTCPSSAYKNYSAVYRYA